MEAELADVAGEELPGLVHDEDEAGEAFVVGGGGVGLLAAELEDLEAVLGDGDAEALEEVVVEEGEVFLFELVLDEC